MRRAAYTLICVFFAALIVAGLVAPDCAWAAIGPELGVADSIGEVTDVIVGHNNRGPYSLSWTDINPDSISVIVNGRSLKKTADYLIDIPKGVISFNSILANDALVRVSYQIQPGKSQRASKNMNIPVTLNLRSSATGSLRVTGLYAQDDPRNPDAGKSIIGLGGDRAWGGGKLNSMFLVSQRNEAAGPDAGLWDRAAMKFGGDTSIGMFKFTGSFLHAGEAFEGAKEYGTGAGKELMNLATSFAPAKTVQAGASYVSSEDTTGENKGKRTVTNEQNLAFTPVDSTRLSLAHSTSELTSPDGKHDTLATSGVQLSSTAIKRATLRSSMTQKTSETLGNEQAFNAGVTAKPIDQLSLDVNYGTLENKAVGQQTSTDVKVAVAPVKDVAVQAAYSGVDSTTLGESAKTNIAIQTTPVKNVQIKGNMADSVVNSDKQFQRDFSLSSTPAQFAKLTAMFSQKGVNNLDDVTRGAELQLTPAKRTRLSAGYRYAETGPQTLTIYDYMAETKPWDFLSLSGKYRQRDVRVSDAVNSAAVSMSLAPARFFTLTGEYMANPEDKQGQVQNFNSASVGLATHIGSLGVETNYFQKSEYLTDTLSDERRLGLALPVFGHGKLTTGCKFNKSLTNSEMATRTYLLGYSHAVGSDFSLSLTGYFTQYLQNKMLQPDKNEVSAEASLGARF